MSLLGVYLQEFCIQGSLPTGGVCIQRVRLHGCLMPPGLHPGGSAQPRPPLWTDWLANTSKNRTIPCRQQWVVENYYCGWRWTHSPLMCPIVIISIMFKIDGRWLSQFKAENDDTLYFLVSMYIYNGMSMNWKQSANYEW